MKPRLLSSKKWTQIPNELNDQIKSVFIEAFQEKLGDSTKFLIDGRIYPQELCLRVGFIEPGRLTQCNFEVSLDNKELDQSPLEKIHLCIDAAASMMLDHIESEGNADLPYTWQPYKFNEQNIYLQFSTENTELEAEADRLLGLSQKSLVSESDDTETEMEVAVESEELILPPAFYQGSESDPDFDPDSGSTRNGSIH